MRFKSSNSMLGFTGKFSDLILLLSSIEDKNVKLYDFIKAYRIKTLN